MAKNRNKQNGVNNAEMNLDRARKIVASDKRGKDFEAALQYLRIYDPENPALKKVEDGVNETVEKALKAMENDKDERGILGDENQDLNNDEDVEKNLNGIISIYAEEGFKTRLNLIVNRDTNHVSVDNEGNILGEGDDKTPEQKDEEKQLRKAVLNEVLEAAKHEVYMFYGRDEKFASYDEEQKRKILEESVTDVFNFKMAKSVAASAVKEATAEEAMPNTEANSSYQQKALADMRAALEAFYTKKPYVLDENGNKKPVTVKPQQILNTTVNTSVAMDEYEQGLRAAKLEKSANTFSKVKENYNEKRRGFWGKAFDMAKGAWQGMKNYGATHWKSLTANAVVFGGGALAISAAPVAIAAGMAAYAVGGAILWPLTDHRQKKFAQAKTEEEKAAWSNKWSLRKAYNDLKQDKKALRNYWAKAGIMGAAQIAGFGVLSAYAGAAGAAAGITANQALANGVAGRVLASTIGAGVNAGAQLGLAKYDDVKEHTDETAANLKAAKKGAVITALTLGVANTAREVLHDVFTGSEVDDVASGGAKGAGNGGGADDAGNSGAEGAGVEGTTVDHTPVDVPTEWNESMGISKAHWDLMQSRFAKSNVSFEEVYTNAYNAKMSNPELFKDIDPVKVVDEYYLKDSWVKEINSYGIYETKEGLLKAIHGNQNATVVEVSDFNNVNPVKGAIYHHQITSFDVDGNPVVHDFYSTDITRLHQHDTMFRLERIIECGEKIEISAADANAMILAERIRGDRNIVVDTFGPCGEKDTYISFVKKHPHIDNTPTPDNTPVKTPAPEAAKVDETFVNKHKTPDGANVDETTTNVQKKAPAEQSFTWKEQKFTGKDNTAISGSGATPEKTVAQGRGVLNSGREM